MKLTVLLVACLACKAMAGGYGRGKPHRIGLYSPAEYYYNHVSAANMLNDQGIPEEFNWCANNGVNYCAASWNQHIPKVSSSCGCCSTCQQQHACMISALAVLLKLTHPLVLTPASHAQLVMYCNRQISGCSVWLYAASQLCLSVQQLPTSSCPMIACTY